MYVRPSSYKWVSNWTRDVRKQSTDAWKIDLRSPPSYFITLPLCVIYAWIENVFRHGSHMEVGCSQAKRSSEHEGTCHFSSFSIHKPHAYKFSQPPRNGGKIPLITVKMIRENDWNFRHLLPCSGHSRDISMESFRAWMRVGFVEFGGSLTSFKKWSRPIRRFPRSIWEIMWNIIPNS